MSIATTYTDHFNQLQADYLTAHLQHLANKRPRYRVLPGQRVDESLGLNIDARWEPYDEVSYQGTQTQYVLRFMPKDIWLDITDADDATDWQYDTRQKVVLEADNDLAPGMPSTVTVDAHITAVTSEGGRCVVRVEVEVGE